MNAFLMIIPPNKIQHVDMLSAHACYISNYLLIDYINLFPFLNGLTLYYHV